MAIRIMHIAEGIGIGGGIENGIANLISRMDPERFDHVLCGIFEVGQQLERYPLDRVQILSLGQKRGRGRTQAPALTALIRRVRPDVVHSRNWGALEAVVAARWARRCSVIHSEHGYELNPGTEPARRYWIRRIAYSLADHVFAVSDELRDHLARRTGYSSKNFGVIHNGVDTSRFRADAAIRRRARSELGIDSDNFCIGCVGRVTPIKDYGTLLRAAEQLNTRCSSWRVLIAGDGVERARFEEVVCANPVLQGKVRFLGTITDVSHFLNALDVFVLPSLCEGISNSLLEAMATGLPVVASNTGGNPEVAIDGESGLFFPVGDARTLARRLEQLHTDYELRSKIGQAASRRIKSEFSLNAMVRRYEELYADGTVPDRNDTVVSDASCSKG